MSRNQSFVGNLVVSLLGTGGLLGLAIQTLFYQYPQWFWTIVVLIVLFWGLWFTTPIISLYVFYNIAIDLMYPQLDRQRGSTGWIARWSEYVFNQLFDEHDRLIYESFGKRLRVVIGQDDPARHSISDSKPTLVRRKHLMTKRFFPKWSFAIVLLFEDLKINRVKQQFPTIPRYELNVDLRDQSYGIYNNAGKKFLYSTFRSDKMKPGFRAQEAAVKSFVRADASNTDEEMNVLLGDVPMRWASGGAMPIVKWKGSTWFLLLFRDITPLGWNIPNGASENKEEYKDIDLLMMREFTEEVVILNKRPAWKVPYSRREQKMFRWQRDGKQVAADAKEFTHRHRQLRDKLDRLTIRADETGPSLSHVSTPFSLKLTYHNGEGGIKVDQINDILFAVNPAEFGIEIVRLVKFDLGDDDYIIDGEIWEADNSLVRQPMMLLKSDFILEEYREKETSASAASHSDCAVNDFQIDNIPAGQYFLFDADVESRRMRLDYLRNAGHTNYPEYDRISRWLDKYGAMFDTLTGSKVDLTADAHHPLTTFCPVTWKCLGLISDFKLLGK